MNMLDRVLGVVAPGVALSRARSRLALAAVLGTEARYDAASAGNRMSRGKGARSDADSAAQRRDVLAAVARDLIRNTPFATRAQQVVANNVVSDGIIPKVTGSSKRLKAQILRAIEDHFDTVAIDADGRQNLYGLQRLCVNAMVDSGEVIIRRRRRPPGDGLPLPFQLQVLEADYLDASYDGPLKDGGMVRDGIVYDAIGRRIAYYLRQEHPGASNWRMSRWETVRVPASEVIHLYRQDRPGQMRGVSWYAPIALALQDLDDIQDAHLMRQKIAACFTAFRVYPDGESKLDDDPAGLSKLTPGRIQALRPGEDIRFATPPRVEGYDDFSRNVLRAAAAGIGVTYEALTGDLTGVNFTSYKAGRIEMNRNVSSWQWLTLVPSLLQPIGAWFTEAWELKNGTRLPRDLRIGWVPPRPQLIDPSREIPAMRDSVRAGFTSRTTVIRELGNDPERVTEEIREDREALARAGLVFDTDARTPVGGGSPAGPVAPEHQKPDGEDTPPDSEEQTANE